MIECAYFLSALALAFFIWEHIQVPISFLFLFLSKKSSFIVLKLSDSDIYIFITVNYYWATVVLSDRCHVCPVLSVCNVGVLWPNVGWIKMKFGVEVGLGHGH